MSIDRKFKDLSSSEIQAVCDRYEVNKIAEINLALPQRMRQLLEINLHPNDTAMIEVDYNEKKAIGDILEGKVRKAFSIGITLREKQCQGKIYSFRVEEPSIEHLFDSEQLRCCSFHPKGLRRRQASQMITNPYAAFVHLVSDEVRLGVSINFLAYMGNKVPVLIVDDVEGNAKHFPKKWGRGFRLANESLQELMGCTG